MAGTELSALRVVVALGIPGVLLLLAYFFLKHAGKIGATLSGSQRLIFLVIYLIAGIGLFFLLSTKLASQPPKTQQSPLDATFSFPAPGILTLPQFLEALQGRVVLDKDLEAILKSDQVKIEIQVLRDVPLRIVLDRILIPQLPVPAAYVLQDNTVVIRRRVSP